MLVGVWVREIGPGCAWFAGAVAPRLLVLNVFLFVAVHATGSGVLAQAPGWGVRAAWFGVASGARSCDAYARSGSWRAEMAG